MVATPTRSAGAVQRPRSQTKQDYGTPWAFIRAVEARFGPISFDLACSRENIKARRGYVFPEENAFDDDWSKLQGNLWLNPPFANIDPWAEKIARECRDRRAFAFLLTPASIGTEWFAEHVRPHAMVLGLSPRMSFEGTPSNPKTGKPDGYPKDLMLSVLGYGMRGFDTWRWRP